MGMNKKDLILLKFTRSEAEAQLDWEHSDEFEYKDQMYDVVESKVKGDTTYYWCWPDDEETKLDSTLDKLLADSFGKDQQQKDNQRTVISIFKSLYCEKLFNWHLLTVIKKPILHLYSLHFNSVVFPPPVPPPETAFCL